jgi:hypothetical protein
MPDFICPICKHRTHYPAGYQWRDDEGPECENEHEEEEPTDADNE